MALRSDVSIDILRRRSEGRLPALLGFHVVEIGEGRLAAQLAIRPDLLAPNGYLHAATVIGLADTACGYGTIAHLPDGAQSFTTIELKCNFLGTAREGILDCEARAAHLGRTTHVWDATVTDRARERAIALFRCTQMILWPK